jgi:hypothetical protein
LLAEREENKQHLIELRIIPAGQDLKPVGAFLIPIESILIPAADDLIPVENCGGNGCEKKTVKQKELPGAALHYVRVIILSIIPYSSASWALIK